MIRTKIKHVGKIRLPIPIVEKIHLRFSNWTIQRYMTIVQGLVSIFFLDQQIDRIKLLRVKYDPIRQVCYHTFLQNKLFLCKANRCSYYRVFKNKKKCRKVDLHPVWLILFSRILTIQWRLQCTFLSFLCSYQRNFLISD